MNINYAYSFIYNFLATHQILSICIAVVLVLFLWKKPKEFFKFSLFILAMILLFYIGTLMNNSMLGGVDDKHQMINETESKMSQ